MADARLTPSSPGQFEGPFHIFIFMSCKPAPYLPCCSFFDAYYDGRRLMPCRAHAADIAPSCCRNTLIYFAFSLAADMTMTLILLSAAKKKLLRIAAAA